MKPCYDSPKRVFFSRNYHSPTNKRAKEYLVLGYGADSDSVSLTLTGNVMSFISNSRSRMNVVVTRCYGES